mmetsp:Transcript_23155/g.51047  ORF Transcript_23155/g.51047 Transcript_23155/m.51047 type:complete len:123 (+) Transcript_23155:42-410(+)|eukprot:CAMPEP_0204253092 /NCGR_PEP_ID=MMETSP0468-20130131/1663_1 /ASSEMBLY_ACC=CAM_ASM_000383 /TAXON_ID=2969 /ORGANISM="Oxyrrhis marina" /LENGTH=122 /DNA_ID=CAMNT_0051226629 /DNA_START=53 /DNA_END=421 /DNA_ORIENTATION=+
MGCFESRCKVEPITDAKQYEELVKNQICVVAMFHKKDAEICKAFLPKFDELAGGIPFGVTFLSVDVDDAKEIAEAQKVTKELPAFRLTIRGEEKAAFAGADEEKIKGEIDKVRNQALGFGGK